MSPTRFYFRATATPSVSPAFHAGWDVTAGAVRRQMATAKLAGDAITSAGNSGTITDDVLYVQFVSEPMAAGLLIPNASDVDSWSYCLEVSGSNNLRGAAAVRVFSQDGTTLRRELTASLITGLSDEWPFTGFPAKSKPFLSSTTDGADYTTVAGDRLVVELGHTSTAFSGTPQGAVRIGSDATGADAPEDLDDVSLTAVGWFEFEPNVTFLADVAAPGGQEGRLRIGLTDVIGWEIDGKPTKVTGDWQAEVSTGWGDRTMTGTVGLEARHAVQGATVVGWKRSGEPLWQGKMVTDPRRDGDLLHIRAEGNAGDLDAIENRLFYRVDGAGEWEDRGADPFGYNQNEKYDLHQGRGSLQWKFGNNADTFNTNDAAGFALWKEGGLISRYTCTLEVNQALGGFDFLTRSFTGPDGTQSDITTETLNFGGPLTLAIDATINAVNREDGMTFVCIRTGAGSTPNGRRRLQVRAIKVYGRTLDADFTVADVVADVADLGGFGTDGVFSNPMLALPLDWTDDPTGLLDYMAELTDWRWMVRGQEMTFGPYGRVWESATGHGASPSLEPQPRANVLRQPFRTLSGSLRHVDASPDVDPFPGRSVVVWGEELEDPQPNADLATAVAAAGIEYEASVRRSGPVELTEVRFNGAPWVPYDVNAGDQLLLTDLAPDLGPQRIESMTYRPGGRATAQLGSAFNLVAALAEAERPARRRQRKRKKRRVTGGPLR